MELRPYQKEVVEEIQTAWDTNQNVMLQMPTGTGKTNVFCEIIKLHIKEHPGKRVLILTHKLELVTQTSKRLWETVGIRPGQIIAGDDENPEHQVQVATVQTLIKRMKTIKFLSNLSLIIVDEAHHTPASTYRELIAFYQSEGTHLLGVTATPRRSDGQGFKDIFQKLIQSWQIKQFIEREHLADVEHRKTATYYDLKKKLESVSIDSKTNDYDENQLGELMSMADNMADAVKSYKRYRGNFKKSIVFAVTVSHSKSLTDRFIENGINAAHVDGKTDPQTRKDILDKFKSGTISVLCNVGIITEGFDCPDAEIVQLVRPTKSLTLYLQQVGRVMRPKPNGSHALILDSASCYDEFGSVKAKRIWKLDSTENSSLDNKGSDEENDKALEPEEDGDIMIKVDEPALSAGPLSKEWFDALPEDYKKYFLYRFSHLDSHNLTSILNAIWVTKEWNLSGLQFESISALRNFNNIISLNISSTKCASLKPIITLMKLEALYVSDSPVSVLRLPKEKESLKRLDISQTKIMDVSIISEYPMLEKLFINNLLLHSESYESMSRLSNLQRLSAKNSNFYSLSTLHYSKERLEVLELNNSKISSISTIQHFQSLRYLDISGTGVTTLDKIRECRSLETLVIKGLNIKKEELRELGNRQPVVWIEY